ncbi:MAG: CHAD domain-containing protein [bacterium]
MKTRLAPTIDDLCEKYRNENAHTGHVTSLALLLFDMSRDWLGLPETDRPLLDAAARLHDVGYALDPACHAVAGAHIVTREGLPGFNAKEVSVITGIMLLHSGPLKIALDSPMFKAVVDRPRALRLGALLRIADALDHGHLQDTSIESAQRGEREIELTVRSELWPGNLVHAEQKADLWRATFPIGILILPTPMMAGKRPPIVTEEHTLPEASQRLLLVQHRLLVDNLNGIMDGRDMECLHVFRTALRRSRTLLHLFRKRIAGTSADAVHRRLTRLRGAIGQARDMDVWLAMLRSGELRKACGRDPRWKPFIERQVRDREALQAGVRRSLTRPSARALRADMGMLLRVELPRAIDTGRRKTSLRAFAAKKLRSALKRVKEVERLTRSDRPSDLHRFRIALRRVRHLGEFFAPALVAGGLVDRIRAAERELGRVHDIDVALARIRSSRSPPPEGLVQHLRKRRDRHIKRFRHAWKRLHADRLFSPGK